MKNDYHEIPNTCPECGGKLEFGKMAKYGIKPYASGYCYICLNCNTHIATHKNDRRKAIGVMADRETKKLRLRCHEEFDALWKTTAQRRYYYIKLSKAMGLKLEDCHFGHMDKKQLLEALSVIERLRNEA